MSRRRKDRQAKGGGSFFERFIFTFMGPPQLGENKPREGFVPDEQANLCHKCARQWDDHERIHTGTITYRRCPTPGE